MAMQAFEETQAVRSLFARGMHSALVSMQNSPGNGQGDSPSDPFTQQLQQRTERELADLLAAAQARKEAAGGVAQEDEDSDSEDLPKVSNAWEFDFGHEMIPCSGDVWLPMIFYFELQNSKFFYSIFFIYRISLHSQMRLEDLKARNRLDMETGNGAAAVLIFKLLISFFYYLNLIPRYIAINIIVL